MTHQVSCNTMPTLSIHHVHYTLHTSIQCFNNDGLVTERSSSHKEHAPVIPIIYVCGIFWKTGTNLMYDFGMTATKTNVIYILGIMHTMLRPQFNSNSFYKCFSHTLVTFSFFQTVQWRHWSQSATITTKYMYYLLSVFV